MVVEDLKISNLSQPNPGDKQPVTGICLKPPKDDMLTSAPLRGMIEVDPMVMTFFFCFDSSFSPPLLPLLLFTADVVVVADVVSGIAISESSSMLLQPMRPG